MIYIRNILLLDPKSGSSRKCDILTGGTEIIRIGEELEKQEFFKTLAGHEMITIDGSGYIAAPGLVDIHSHFRDPGFTEKEDLETGSRAALRGGYTSVVLMANTRPPVDNEDTLCYIMEKARKQALHIYSCACVTKEMRGEELTDLKGLFRAGAAGFTDDGKPVLQEAVLRKAMEICAELKVPVSLHEEDPRYIRQNGINAGAAAQALGLEGSDRMAEISLVKRDLQIALETGAAVNIQHISTKEAVELVRQAKKQGGSIHAEATPHHFTLTEEAVKRYGTLAKVNPPLRTEEDRQAIIEGLQDGTIDLIATDHAPHCQKEKEQTFEKAPSGMTGLETALSLGVTMLVKEKKLSMMELLEKMTWNPAKLYHLNAGYLAEGGPADIVIFDPEAVARYDSFASKASNTPFAHGVYRAEVEYTIAAGKIAYIREMEMTETDDEERMI